MVAIARDRWRKLACTAAVRARRGEPEQEIHYGKAEVSTYRTYATPLTGSAAIPESAFTGRPNVLLAAEIDVQVLGESFLAAYTEGDNSNVVATDTMKNFIHRQSLAFAGSTLEGWLYFLGSRFLETYPQMERLRMSGVELPFEAAPVPADGGGFGPAACSSIDATTTTRSPRWRSIAPRTSRRWCRTCDRDVSAWTSSRSPARRSPRSRATSSRRCRSVAIGRYSRTSMSPGGTPMRAWR